jgi:hypothetical protein
MRASLNTWMSYAEAHAEVSRVLSHCYSRDLAVVPLGGNTGLVAGAVPVLRGEENGGKDGTTGVGGASGRRLRGGPEVLLSPKPLINSLNGSSPWPGLPLPPNLEGNP